MIPTRLYFITCQSTGKSYVGITRFSMKKRWGEHVTASREPKNKFTAAVAQYGPADFDVSVLAVCPSWDDACEAEKDIIAGLDLTRLGYNTALGGDDGMSGHVKTPEHRAKISAGLRGHAVSTESRTKMAQAKKGRTLPPGHRDHIAQSGLRRWERQRYADARMPTIAMGTSSVDMEDIVYA